MATLAASHVVPVLSLIEEPEAARPVPSVPSRPPKKGIVNNVELERMRTERSVRPARMGNSQQMVPAVVVPVQLERSQNKTSRAVINVSKGLTPTETPVLRARTVKSRWEARRAAAIVHPEHRPTKLKHNVNNVKPERTRLVVDRDV